MTRPAILAGRRLVALVLCAVLVLALILVGVVSAQTDDSHGSISAVTVTEPAAAAAADLPYTLTPLSTGTPVVDAELSDGQAHFDSLAPGRYRLQAQVAEGFDPTGLSCEPNAAVATIYGDRLTAIIDVEQGQEIACTVSAAQLGTIVVELQATPDTGNPTFKVSPSWSSAFTLAPGESRESQQLVAGEYSVSQKVPEAWLSKAATCDDGSDPSAIGLDPGETVTCTFQTEKRGRVLVVNRARPADSGQRFTFDPSWDKQFSLAAGQTRKSGWLRPGSHSVARQTPDGWDATSVSCNDGSKPKKINLEAGETVTCTFGSTQRGRIVTVNEADPSDNGTSFTFNPSWGTQFQLQDGQSSTSRPLEPGRYRIKAPLPKDWVTTSATCDDGSKPNAVKVGAGETVTCTFHRVRPEFTVATFNVLGNSHTAKGGRVPHYASGATRMNWTVDLMQQWGVDIIGFQEFQNPQMDAFVRRAGSEFGIYPNPGMNQRNKQNAIAWRNSVFELVDARPVMIPYFHGKLVPMPLVRLRHRASGEELYVMTVHNPASTRWARNQGRWRTEAMNRQIAVTRDVLNQGVPMLMTGDMNERAEYFCAYTASGSMHAAAGGSNDGVCRPPPSSRARIDWIFGSQSLSFSDYHLFRDNLVRRTSDHPFIVSDAVLLRRD